MTVTNQAENDRMIAARLKLIREYVFFGCLAMRLQFVEVLDMPFMAATDGKVIIYNPNLTKDLTIQEIVGLVAHEVCHPICLHHLRRGNREPTRWNHACDYVVNLILLENFNRGSGFALPKGGLVDNKYKGMASEEVYNLLPDMKDEPKAGGGSGGRQFDDIMDGAKGLTESEVKAEEGRIKAEIQNAAALARKAGQMTQSLEKLVEAICEPKADWRAILRDRVTAKAENDYNWAAPHQRMLHQYSIVYPTLDGEKLGEIVLIIDASGSCYSDQEQFCSEFSDILMQYDVDAWVIYFDTQVKSVERYSSSDLPIVMSPKGFGGTQIESTLTYVEEQLNPDLVIILTDGELRWPDDFPFDTIIACTEKRSMGSLPNWAQHIEIS